MARDEDGSPNAGSCDALSGRVLQEGAVEVVMRTRARAPSARRRRREAAQSRRKRVDVFGVARANVRFTVRRRPT
jgi:hypothetical protein